ncbi:MAG: outer membrane protein assembly factor BamA [Hyphomicrobiales bacterium]|nr:outer membrane protein assembly factor BamA [Hyphomicrobiales bacterium]
MLAEFNKTKTIAYALMFNILLLLSSVTMLIGAVSEVQAAVVNQISVIGNERMDSDTVASYLTIKPGSSYNNGDVDESVKRLFATGLFRDVGISRRGKTLIVEVDENPTINEVFFEGNKRLKDPALRSSVQSASRSIFSEETVLSDVETISNAYSRVGREDASVSYEVVELSNNRVNVIFNINEGDKTKILSIQFNGNSAISDFRLKDIIKTKESNFLSFIRTNDIYDPAKIQADEELLRRYYYNHGFADFQLISTIADLDPSLNQYNIIFNIDEGSLYKFGEVSIESTISGLSVDEFYDELEIRSGSSYSARDVESSINQLTNAVAARGHAFVEVVPRGDRNFQTGTIDVVFLIDEGPRVYIERIDILGNDRTRDFVIRREFDISEGDAFSQSGVKRTKARLEGLGFFDRVDISTRPGSTPDRVVVVVRVADKATGEFSIGGGYSSSDGAIANIKFSEKNFLGRGQHFAITAGLGADDQEYRLAFTEPYFLGYRLSAGFELGQTLSDTSSGKAYGTNSTTGALRFSVPLTDHLAGGLFYSFDSSDMTIPSSLIDSTDGIQGNNDVNSEISAAIAPWQGSWVASVVGYSLVYADFDNPKTPREGVKATFNQGFAGVGGDATFLKTVASVAAYVPLSKDVDIVGFGRVRAGHILNLGSSGSYRVLDNFRQGSHDIRGFDSYGFGPRDPVTDDALGGMTYFNATAEVQFPLPLIPESAGLRAALFADAGTLYDVDSASRALIAAANPTASLSSIDDNSFRASIGVSVIWDSPFGPIRFDFAEPVISKTYDNVRRFNFGASTSF